MTTSAKKTKDPVCGMSVDPSHCSCKTEHENKEYCFCCENCREKFKKNPAQFAKK